MPVTVAADGPIEEFFRAAWADRTLVTTENMAENPSWRPVDADKVLIPWVYLEITGTGSEIAGTGTPGNHLWTDFGIINVHCFSPVGEGESRVRDLARAAGEVFRAAAFYESPDGRRIRTLAPRVDGGGSGSDDGAWYRNTMTVEYTYWYRA